VKNRREHQNIFYHLINNDLVKSCPVLSNIPKGELTETLP